MYKMVDMSLWQGRVDDEEDPQLATRLHQVVQAYDSGLAIEKGLTLGDSNTDSCINGNPNMTLLGFACDEGVRRNKGRVGAAKGPDILRQTMANLPWHPQLSVVDSGNIYCEDSRLEHAHEELAEHIVAAYKNSSFVFVLGGGHEVAYGSWLGLLRSLENSKTSLSKVPRVGVINFDAHFDLRSDENGVSSGTPFFQIAKVCEEKNWPFNYACFGVSEASNTQALFQRANDLNVLYRYDHQMTAAQLSETSQELVDFIEQVDVIYLTICLDVLPASVAPGVSAPAARGVGLEVIETLVEIIRDSGKLKLADIAEFNPDYDIDHWTARIAARLFYLISYK